MATEIICDDVMHWAKNYTGEPFHAMLTDCPYELSFMSKKWDASGISFQPSTWAALSEHLLPGAFIFVFGSSRGWHRLAVAIEDGGFVFHPSLMIWGWVSGSGFPKSTNIHLQLEKRLCYQDEDKDWFYKDDNKPIRTKPPFRHPTADRFYGHRYGRQAMKPAVEMLICAQKPYEGKPVDSIVETGAGALFIDGGRVGTSKDVPASVSKTKTNGIWGKFEKGGIEDGDGFNPNMGRWPPNFCLVHVPPHICADCDGDGCGACNDTGLVGGCQRAGTKRVKGITGGESETTQSIGGRGAYQGGDNRGFFHYADADGYEETTAWLCSESCAARRIGEQSGERPSGGRLEPGNISIWNGKDNRGEVSSPMGQSTGTCARFFPQFDWAAEIAERLANSDQVRYCSKASRSERDAGLEAWAQTKNVERYGQRGKCIICGRWQEAGENHCTCGGNYERQSNQHKNNARNPHPTIKPISLCIWLCRLLLPPPEYAPRRILVPFCGAASEMISAVLAGWEFVQGIEMSEEYCAIGEARLKFWSQFSSYEAAMDAARNIQQSHRKQEAQAQSGQLKLTL